LGALTTPFILARASSNILCCAAAASSSVIAAPVLHLPPPFKESCWKKKKILLNYNYVELYKPDCNKISFCAFKAQLYVAKSTKTVNLHNSKKQYIYIYIYMERRLDKAHNTNPLWQKEIKESRS
jgi:hypothetical protein